MSIRNDTAGEGLGLSSGIFNYNSAYTITAWVRPAQVNSAWHGILSVNYNNASANADFCAINASNQWTVGGYNGGNGMTLELGGTAVQDTWYHVAMIRSTSSALRLLVNGSQIGGDYGYGMSGRTAADQLSLGFYPWNTGQFLNGRIANVKVWTAALTAAEVIQESQTIRPSQFTGLWAWYPLLTHSELNDYSGNGRNLSALGTLSTEDHPPVTWGA